ncbi:MAG: YkgJ family cysteine cluster protein [Desulfobacteraceae bacterium]|nr:YkgJ family cysteine cluster protein [Desulfobacteraceae bacterium]
MNTGNNKTSYETGQGGCIRCGTCCEKGGPALHRDDLAKVLEKRISPENLYTIRKGEMVYDNVKGGLVRTPVEIVKIKSAKGSKSCIYYDSDNRACSIYEIRPLECRIMACWDFAPSEAAYAVDRLNRESVFGTVDWLMELIRTHEEKCGYDRIEELSGKRLKNGPGSAEEIIETVRYDNEMRRVIQEKTGIKAEMMDLIFGRPLESTIPAQFGIKIMRNTPPPSES